MKVALPETQTKDYKLRPYGIDGYSVYDALGGSTEAEALARARTKLEVIRAGDPNDKRYSEKTRLYLQLCATGVLATFLLAMDWYYGSLQKAFSQQLFLFLYLPLITLVVCQKS